MSRQGAKVRLGAQFRGLRREYPGSGRQRADAGASLAELLGLPARRRDLLRRSQPRDCMDARRQADIGCQRLHSRLYGGRHQGPPAGGLRRLALAGTRSRTRAQEWRRLGAVRRPDDDQRDAVHFRSPHRPRQPAPLQLRHQRADQEVQPAGVCVRPGGGRDRCSEAHLHRRAECGGLSPDRRGAWPLPAAGQSAGRTLGRTLGRAISGGSIGPNVRLPRGALVASPTGGRRGGRSSPGRPLTSADGRFEGLPETARPEPGREAERGNGEEPQRAHVGARAAARQFA